jgi:hypothetical protein
VVLEFTATGMAPLRVELTDQQASELAARLSGTRHDSAARHDGTPAASLLAGHLRDGVPAAASADALITLRTEPADEPADEPLSAGVPLGRLTEFADALVSVLAGSAERRTVARHSNFQIGDRVVVRNPGRGRAAGGRPGEVVRVHVAWEAVGTEAEPEFWYDVVLDGRRSGYPQTFLAGDLVAESDVAENDVAGDGVAGDDRDPGGLPR